MGRRDRVPLLTTGRDSVALRDVPRRGAGVEAGDGGDVENRTGLQQQPVQHGAPSDDIPLEFLIAFTRHLVRGTVSPDALYLALAAAAGECGVPKARMQEVLQKVLLEHAASRVWPKGF